MILVKIVFKINTIMIWSGQGKYSSSCPRRWLSCRTLSLTNKFLFHICGRRIRLYSLIPSRVTNWFGWQRSHTNNVNGRCWWWCNGTFGQFDDWPKITPFWHPQKNLYNITITTPFNITTAAIHSAPKMRKYCKSISWTYFKTAALTQIFNQFPRFEICSTLKWSFLDFPKSCTFLFLGTL